MKEVNYKQGNTTVWSDGEKVVIKNPIGRRHIEANVDRIFGVGEYKKLYEHKYSDDEKVNPRNNLAKMIEIVAGYIPERVKKDLDLQSLPGLSGKDLTKEYFKK